MDVTARYTMVPAVHANLVHPVSWRADKLAMVSVISRDVRVALKIAVIGKIIQMQEYRGKITHMRVRISRDIEILDTRVFFFSTKFLLL